MPPKFSAQDADGNYAPLVCPKPQVLATAKSGPDTSFPEDGRANPADISGFAGAPALTLNRSSKSDNGSGIGGDQRSAEAGAGEVEGTQPRQGRRDVEEPTPREAADG